ncbi:hypothetical protein TRIUR3_29498 [Triticum urartu]|uniref:Uncharacterized protein n=1 Tax=Triticum urartu TaxID=4572 RepID=M7ZK53_TRIUA|nr:hypothetical protein TRIUR3_29498 [Triticum urartu]
MEDAGGRWQQPHSSGSIGYSDGCDLHCIGRGGSVNRMRPANRALRTGVLHNMSGVELHCKTTHAGDNSGRSRRRRPRAGRTSIPCGAASPWLKSMGKDSSLADACGSPDRGNEVLREGAGGTSHGSTRSPLGRLGRGTPIGR